MTLSSTSALSSTGNVFATRARKAVFSCAALCGAVFAAAAGFAVSPSATTLEVLGADASVYRLHLVAHDSDPDGSVLELEIARAGELPTRMTVPGTDDVGREHGPSLSFSDATNTLLLVWEDQVNLLHSKLRIMGYREADGFVELLDVAGSPFYAKRRPQVVLTSDNVRWTETTQPVDQDAPGVETHHQVVQRVLHLAWREDQGHIFYQALAEGSNGASVATETLNLSTLLPELPATIGNNADGSLSVVAGRNSRTILLIFIDPIERTLETVEVSSVPIEISMLADAGFESVLDAEQTGADLVGASEAARSRIVFIGRQLISEATTGVISDAAAGTVMASQQSLDDLGWVGVAEEARSRIVFIGRSLEIDRQRPAGDVGFELALPFAPTLEAEPSSEPTVNLQIIHLSSRQLPGDVPDTARIIVSEDGDHALLFWGSEDGLSLFFTESAEDGWKQTLTLSVEQVGSLENAENLVRQRFGKANR